VQHHKELSALLSVPFVDGGRDPKSGLDCYGLCRSVASIYGQEFPEFSEAFNDAISRHMAIIDQTVNGQWEKLGSPEPGCLVVMAIDGDSPDVCQHVGMYIGDDHIMHTLAKTGVHIIRTDHKFYKNKIKGYFKWNGSH
jgi:cell wall-associated NlpC family hydrolase